MIRNKIMASVAAAGLLSGGAVALAATTASAAPVAATVMSYPYTPDQLSLTYQGKTYTYNVHLHEQWVAPGVKVISGWLHDGYEPQAINLPVHGVQFGNDAVFSVQYPTTGPDAGNQGDRTFSGVVAPDKSVTGNVTETGTEGLGIVGGAVTFTLDRI